jgi:hypothetical protein
MTVNISKPAVNVREKLAELDKPTGIAGEAMLRAETPQEQFNLIGAGRRNIIINGDMRIAQRGTSTTKSAGGSSYCLDRFSLGNNTGSAVLTASQQSDGPVTTDGAFKYYVQVNVDTADTNGGNNEFAAINYYVEANDWEPLGYGAAGAKQATLSFYHAHSISGTYCLSIRNSGGGSNRNYLVEYNQDQADVWQKTTVTLEGDTAGTWSSGTTAGISIMFTMTNGSTYQGSTTNQWFNGTYYHSTPNQTSLTATTNAKFRITGVQLEVGKVATPFEHRSYGEELALCQRYFERFDYTSTVYENIAAGYASNSTRCRTHFNFFPKRSVPTVGSSAVSTFRVNEGGSTDAVCSAIQFTNVGKQGCGILFDKTGGGMNSGAGAYINRQLGSSPCFIEFDAEL